MNSGIFHTPCKKVNLYHMCIKIQRPYTQVVWIRNQKKIIASITLLTLTFQRTGALLSTVSVLRMFDFLNPTMDDSNPSLPGCFFGMSESSRSFFPATPFIGGANGTVKEQFNKSVI